MARSEFSEKVIELIRSVPHGRVCTYGQIALMAGNPKAARQVSYILHSCSKKENLPWHRIIGKSGKISIKQFEGYEMQKHLLECEGIEFDLNGKINMKLYLWNPAK